MEVARAYIHYPIRYYLEDTDDRDYEWHSNCDGCLHSISDGFLEVCLGQACSRAPHISVEMGKIVDIKICTEGRRIDDENRGFWWQSIKDLARWIAKRNLDEMSKI